MAKQGDMTEYEYQILTNTWDGPYGAAWNVACETCIEFGWMDHFGTVTPKGYRAMKEYQNER